MFITRACALTGAARGIRLMPDFAIGPDNIRAANAKEETTGRTGALGFLICVLSPIDDFGEKNIMRLFVLFLD